MELLYVWIEDYKNIHHQGFNFSPRYRFEFNFEKKELTVEESNDALPDNFFGENIINVTAIVGQNGSGKSTLLDFIIRNYWSFNVAESEPDGKVRFLAVLKNGNQYFLKDIFYIVKSKPNTLTWNKLRPFSTVLDNTSARHFSIFYSNFISGRNSFKTIDDFLKHGDDPAFNSIYDISSERLCYEDKEINKFSLNENFRQFYFSYSDSYTNLLASGIPFKKFPELKISFIKNRPLIVDSRLSAVLQSYFNESKSLPFYEYSDEINIEYFFYTHIITNFCTNVFNLSYIDSKSELVILFKNLKGIGVIETMESFHNRKIMPTFDSPSENDLKEVIQSIKDILRELPKIKNAPELKIDFENYFELFKELLIKAKFNFPDKTIHIELNKEIESKFKEFILLYKKSLEFTTDNYFAFEWAEMSNGEKAMLSLFSRFDSLIDKDINIKFDLSKADSILILIDEGEVGFHPEWQRKYLKYLIDFFPQIYLNKQIQIILTTHSPFLASDLPKENIIFLKKGNKGEKLSDGTDAEGKCIVVDGLKNKEKTFAANIHTLLSDSFFLEGGLIGEFASGKIKEIQTFYKEVKEIEKALIDEKIFDKSKDERLVQKKADYESKKSAFWKIQRMIGEEYLAAIIKNHLNEIETILYGIDAANDEKIARLKKELEALENAKGKKPE